MNDTTSVDEKKIERNAFLFLTIFMAPIVSTAIVVVLGFSIWITQLIMGPPGV